MNERAHHCPFLNRADDRCSTNFSLDRLDHAFGYCFGSYAQCAMYAELLNERQYRRSNAAQPVGAQADLSHCDRLGCWSQWPAETREADHGHQPLIQLTIPRVYQKQSA
jgi:hypothetical protein